MDNPRELIDPVAYMEKGHKARLWIYRILLGITLAALAITAFSLDSANTKSLLLEAQIIELEESRAEYIDLANQKTRAAKMNGQQAYRYRQKWLDLEAKKPEIKILYHEKVDSLQRLPLPELLRIWPTQIAAVDSIARRYASSRTGQ